MSYPKEPVSFERLAQDVSPSLRRYLRRLVGNEALAEDLLQDTLLRMTRARGLSAYSGHAAFKTWAFSIATHAVADHFRKPGGSARIVDVSEADDVPDTGRSIDERLVVDEMKRLRTGSHRRPARKLSSGSRSS